jgi:glycogen operon protein
MLLSGDEIGRTQAGNNNAYCQDNEISWVDWSRAASERDLLLFTRRLARLRRHHPVFRRRRFFRGPYVGTGQGAADIAWLTPAGDEMTEADWRASYAKSVAVFLNGSEITEPDPRGDRVTDQKFLVLFNAGPDPITFTIPGTLGASGGAVTDWEIVIDTENPRGEPQDEGGFLPKTKVEVARHAIVVLRSRD